MSRNLHFIAVECSQGQVEDVDAPLFDAALVVAAGVSEVGVKAGLLLAPRGAPALASSVRAPCHPYKEHVVTTIVNSVRNDDPNSLAGSGPSFTPAG